MAKRNFESYTEEELIEKIRDKKEFREIPIEDIKLVYIEIYKKGYTNEGTIKESRDLLRKMYTAFVNEKILTKKEKDAEWFMSKHISTKERINDYPFVYKKALNNLVENKNKIINVIDFGCGINGFSYGEFSKLGFNVKYIGTEPVGQLVNSQNLYFKKNKMNAECKKISLFEIEKNIQLIKKLKGVRVAFFFKVLDSLEMLKKDYSKEVLNKIIPNVDRVVISWATKSLVSKRKFMANRKWLINFLKEKFNIVSEFETEFEKYIIVTKK